MAFYVPVGPSGILFRVGVIWTGVTGSLSYWWANRRRGLVPVALPSLHPSGWSQRSLLRRPNESSARKDEVELIRRACVDLGADLEMTKLVLASHSHDRTLLDVMLANGDSLRDYVQCKLAIWDGIFNDSLY